MFTSLRLYSGIRSQTPSTPGRIALQGAPLSLSLHGSSLNGVSCDSGGAFFFYHAFGCRGLFWFRRGPPPAPAPEFTAFFSYHRPPAKKKEHEADRPSC